MKKLLLSFCLITALNATIVSAKPETWYGKLAAAPIQIIHSNSYNAASCITTPIALYGAFMYHVCRVHAQDKLKCNPNATIWEHLLAETHPIIPTTLIAALWVGTTYVAGSFNKATSKALMNAFDIPELE